MIFKRRERLFRNWWTTGLQPDDVENELKTTYNIHEKALIAVNVVLFFLTAGLFYGEMWPYSGIALGALVLAILLLAIRLLMRAVLFNDIVRYRDWYHVQTQIEKLMK
ncbi:hypothetical protein ACDP95_04715 [Weissella confusa]|uniref:DUF202 domain-containing protein n=1 Tax=Weissella confusa TaxID=1583 RepID=A0A4Z0S030_WEICO|nr:hypothetical protein [Weissella confusa]TGE72422.1 hypothetical protein C6P11_06315 [Weissella confusa]